MRKLLSLYGPVHFQNRFHAIFTQEKSKTFMTGQNRYKLSFPSLLHIFKRLELILNNEIHCKLQFVIILFYIKWQITLNTQSDRNLARNVGDGVGVFKRK